MLGMLNTVLRKFLQATDDMLPAKVVSYDRDSNRAVLQPMVAMLTTEGATVSRAQVQGVPVLRIGGGGHVLAFNLKEGDFGWIKANDRDISLFAQSFSATAPNTTRFHSFEDALFIPDAMKDVVIKGEDDENAVFQTIDGKYRIALWDDRIKITADNTTVELKTGTAEITAPLTMTINAPNILLNGNVTSGGGAGTPNLVLAASASITMSAPAIAINSANLVINGTRYDSHHHASAVGTGGSQTGGIV
jgi:hypothetical protein